MKSLRAGWLLADIFHAPHADLLDHVEQALIEVDSDGIIASVLRPGDIGYEAQRDRAASRGDLQRLPPGQYLLPGFVDLHVHAPQYPQLGQALDVPLEVWLHRYTFPLEARFADLDFARRCYSALVEDLLAGGTTTALYFATVDQQPTRLLVDICLELGQRALVGKVVMDDPQTCPDYYRDADADAAIADTRALIEYVRDHPGNRAGRVLPVITPRFIPSCTDATLEGLGRLAGECGCHVQTHCSESDWAHGYVLARYGRSDAASLDAFGLLTRRTVLAHSNLMSDDDLALVAARGSAVAHCPYSNAFFANAVFPLRRALDKGVHVGLGTDISGGPSASMFDAARLSVTASRMLEDGVAAHLAPAERATPGSRIDFVTAFHLATAGGGIALDLPIGLFRPGYRFDAMVIDTTVSTGTIRNLVPVEPLDMLQKIINTASKPNIAAVWVDGLLTGQAPSRP